MDASKADIAVAAKRTFRLGDFARNQLRNIAPFITLLALVLFFSIASPSFATLDNLENILQQVSVTGIIAVGLTFVILTAEIDLSVGAIANATDWGWATALRDIFERQGYVYTVFFIALIYLFCYFWTAIIFNPKDVANNLKDYGSFIPGYRPGKRTAEYLERVMIRITYVGAAFLAVIAVIPTIIATTMGVNYLVASFYGGTGLLIVISVALDLVQKINSHLVMRNYPGLTED